MAIESNTSRSMNDCVITGSDSKQHTVKQIYVGPAKTQVWRVYKTIQPDNPQLVWALYDVTFKTLANFNSTTYTQYSKLHIIRHHNATVSNPVRPGFEFDSWKCVSNLDRGKTTDQRSTVNDIVSDCVFEAQYHHSEYFERISFDKTQITAGSLDITVTREGTKITPSVSWYDDYCEITGLHYDDVIEFTPHLNAGYDFIKWNDTEGNSVKSSTVSLYRKIVIRSSDKMTLVSTLHKYTVTVKSIIETTKALGGGKTQINGNGYSVTTILQIPYLSDYVIDTLPNTYYKFSRLEDTSGHIVSERGKVRSDMTLYALFTDADIVLSYDNNDGVTPIRKIPAICRQQVTIALPTAREGYTFQGWLCDGVTYQANSIAVFDKDVTLVAQWKVNTYNVTLNFQNCGPVRNVLVNNDGVETRLSVVEGSGNQTFTYTVKYKSNFTVQILDETASIYAVFNDNINTYVYGHTARQTETNFKPISTPSFNYSSITKNQTLYIGIIVKSRELEHRSRTGGEVVDVSLPYGALLGGLSYRIEFTNIRVWHLGDSTKHIMHAYFGYSVKTDYVTTERTATGLAESGINLQDVTYNVDASSMRLNDLVTIIAQCRDHSSSCAGIRLRAKCTVTIM